MAEGAALEMLCAPKGYRGFKSLPLRHFPSLALRVTHPSISDNRHSLFPVPSAAHSPNANFPFAVCLFFRYDTFPLWDRFPER